MSHYELGDNQRAKKAFINAAKYSKNRKAAQQWLDYIKVSK
jgi:hypothetical protein